MFRKIVQNAKIENFLWSESKANSSYDEYISLFINNKADNINYETINTYSIVYKCRVLQILR